MVRSTPSLTRTITYLRPLPRVRRHARMVPRRPSPQIFRVDRLRRECVPSLLSSQRRTRLSCGCLSRSFRHGIVDPWLRPLGTQAGAQRRLEGPPLALRPPARAQPVCPADVHRLLRPQLRWSHRLREFLSSSFARCAEEMQGGERWILRKEISADDHVRTTNTRSSVWILFFCASESHVLTARPSSAHVLYFASVLLVFASDPALSLGMESRVSCM